MPYNNFLLESWTNDSIQNPTTDPTTSSWNTYSYLISHMTMNSQPFKDLLWAEQAILIQKARTSKTKTASKIINMTSSPQPPIQTAGDNISAANQPTTSNVSVS